jgi:uncharacterized protein YxjI
MKMEIEDWTGRIMHNKKRMEVINFRADYELALALRKLDNKSDIIREAVREKLQKIEKPYLISAEEKFIYK